MFFLYLKVTYYASYFCAASLQYFLPVSITFLAALMLKTLGIQKIFWLVRNGKLLGSIQFLQLWNHVEMANRSDLQNNLISNILLSPAIHRPLWSLFLVVLLGIHSLLSIIGTIGKGTFIHGVWDQSKITDFNRIKIGDLDFIKFVINKICSIYCLLLAF